MALVLAVEYSTSNTDADCTEAIYDDDTGTYNAGTNPGGWGSPNPERTDYNLYGLLTDKQPEGTDTDTAYTNNAAEADTLTAWTYEISADGWYRAYSIAIRDWDATAAYSVNQIIYYLGTLYKCIVTTSAGEDPVSAPSKWTSYADTAAGLREIIDNTSTYSQESTIYVAYADYVEKCRANGIYGDVWELESSEKPSQFTPELAYKITAFLEGGKVAEARGKYAEANSKILKVSDLGVDLNCINC
jgi:hypothetical protein